MRVGVGDGSIYIYSYKVKCVRRRWRRVNYVTHDERESAGIIIPMGSARASCVCAPHSGEVVAVVYQFLEALNVRDVLTLVLYI